MAPSGPPAGFGQEKMIDPKALSHNLLVLREYEVEKTEGVPNTRESKCKAKKLETASLAEKGETVPVLLRGFQRLTQRSVKHIRWLRVFCVPRGQLAEAVYVMGLSYATFWWEKTTPLTPSSIPIYTICSWYLDRGCAYFLPPF